jgi:hypothetical protein
MINPLSALADIAATQIGHHEDGSSNTGSEIAAYQAATDLGIPKPGHGWPWCCAFVDWCIQQFIKANPGVLSCEGNRPKTASVTGFLEWATESGQLVLKGDAVPQRGDIVLMRFKTGWHIGIVTAPLSGPCNCATIEGNTAGTEQGDQRNGGEVAAKKRGNWGEIRAYVRLSVKARKV